MSTEDIHVILGRIDMRELETLQHRVSRTAAECSVPELHSFVLAVSDWAGEMTNAILDLRAAILEATP